MRIQGICPGSKLVELPSCLSLTTTNRERGERASFHHEEKGGEKKVRGEERSCRGNRSPMYLEEDLSRNPSVVAHREKCEVSNVKSRLRKVLVA